LAEHTPEKRGVTGSTPVSTTTEAHIKRCVAASDETEVFFEMGANDTITRLDGPPDF
jgi:hypothetical protein